MRDLRARPSAGTRVGMSARDALHKEQGMKTTTPIRSVLFLAFPNVGEQDLLAPWELLRAVAWGKSQRGESLEVALGAFEPSGSVTTQMGARLAVERQLRPGLRAGWDRGRRALVGRHGAPVPARPPGRGPVAGSQLRRRRGAASRRRAPGRGGDVARDACQAPACGGHARGAAAPRV